ncbi:hypothetical protein AMTRI_Chr09g22290 [Amborella trichopoda]
MYLFSLLVHFQYFHRQCLFSLLYHCLTYHPQCLFSLLPQFWCSHHLRLFSLLQCCLTSDCNTTSTSGVDPLAPTNFTFFLERMYDFRHAFLALFTFPLKTRDDINKGCKF